MKMNHLTHCLLVVGAAAALLIAFGVQTATVLTLIVALACPLMMIVMMRGMTSAGHGAEQQDAQQEKAAGQDLPTGADPR